MNRSQGNLQDAFLNSARRESIGVTIYLVSGVQLRGLIRAFDAFTVLLESQGRPPQMVYKHAIASVAPVRTVPLDGSMREEQAEPHPDARPSISPASGEGTGGSAGPEPPESPESNGATEAPTVTEAEPTPELAPREVPVSP